MKRTKERKGITLIALAITIAVLLILAGVTINAVIGDDGIIKKAQESARLTEESEAKEIMQRIVLEYELKKNGETLEEFLQTKVPDKIDSVTNNGDGTLTISKNGYTITVKNKGDDGKVKGKIELSDYSGEYTYPNGGTFTVTKSSGTISVTSSDTNIATVSLNGDTVTVTPGTLEGTATITVTSGGTEEYTEATAKYTANVKNGTIVLNVDVYSGTYDGKAHDCFSNVSVVPADVSVEYSTDNTTFSNTMPTITEVSSKQVTIRASKEGYKTKTESYTITVKEAPTFTETSGVGCYADINGDGVVDGIIFEDFLIGGSGQRGSNSEATYTVNTTSGVKQYIISQEKYNGPFGEKNVLTAKGSGSARFYVMALNDIDGTYYFDAAQNLGSNGWTVPSKDEWAAFGAQLGINESNYAGYKLQAKYWSSSKSYGVFNINYYGYYADFSSGTIGQDFGGSNDKPYNVRLVTTF